MKILCIGEALIDMICTDKGKSLSEGDNFLKKPGGAPTNVAAAIAALGGPFVYANNAVVSVNDLDGSIIFGEVVAKEGDKQHVIPKVKVIMAAPFVRRLRDLLVSYPWDEEPQKED